MAGGEISPISLIQQQSVHCPLLPVMGSCCVKQQLTEEDIKFLKKHTRYDEDTIRTADRFSTLSSFFWAKIKLFFYSLKLRIAVPGQCQL